MRYTCIILVLVVVHGMLSHGRISSSKNDAGLDYLSVKVGMTFGYAYDDDKNYDEVALVSFPVDLLVGFSTDLLVFCLWCSRAAKPISCLFVLLSRQTNMPFGTVLSYACCCPVHA